MAKTIFVAALLVIIMATGSALASTTNDQQTAIDQANAQSRFWNLAVIVWVVVAGLIGAWLAYMAWKAGSKASDLAMTQANARIAEAGQKAAEADARRMALEKQLEPRMIVRTHESEQDLRLFEGQKAFVVYAPDDRETLSLALQI
ncbi:MAG: hypothetical protein ACREMY_26480, partial [bacterium]